MGMLCSSCRRAPSQVNALYSSQARFSSRSSPLCARVSGRSEGSRAGTPETPILAGQAVGAQEQAGQPSSMARAEKRKSTIQ